MSNIPVSKDPAYQSISNLAIFAVFDLELTGLDITQSRIIDAGIILCDKDGNILYIFETLVNPYPQTNTGPEHVHGISMPMVINAPHLAEVAENIVELHNNRIAVGLNNKSVDFPTYERTLGELGIKFHAGSSLDLSNMLRDSKFLDMYFGEITQAVNSQETEHRALPDAMVAALILPYAIKFAAEFPERVRPMTETKVVIHDHEPLRRELHRIARLSNC